MKRPKIRDASIPGIIEEAGYIIRRGGLVAFPTETVYGLGADATNPVAVARIFEAKGRPSFDPLIVHVLSSSQAAQCGDFSGEDARKLAERFWPGPLSLVVKKSGFIPPIVTAGLDTVAVRVPSHPVAITLIRAAGRAVAAPSANLFGCVSPTSAGHVADQLGDRVDFILDGGCCTVGIESTILSLADERPSLLRAGGVPVEALEELLGPIAWRINEPVRPLAPGQLTRHYATRTPLQILPENRAAIEPRSGERVGLLTLRRIEGTERYQAVEVLSESGDLREAAARLFAALRILDSLGLDRLVACPVPEKDLGRAIMDRLRRCAAMIE